MKIAIIGTGYVGLTTGTCLANLGNDVICLDVDENKILSLNQGKVPFYEPGLQEMMLNNSKSGRLKFTTSYPEAVEFADVIFICVGTPQSENGEADLKYVFSAAKSIGQNLNGYKIIVNKSTVPVGTADKVKDIISQNTQRDFGVVSNPEFLKEGSAIKDFMNPDRVVLGVNDEKEEAIMTRIYKGVERVNHPIIITDVKSAELIKYAANCMLATRISFMNQISNLCEKVGANIKEIAKGIGLDDRIGPRFLQAGIGYGGSCFPKDVRAMASMLQQYNCENDLIMAVDNVNKRQPINFLNKIKQVVGDVNGKTFAVLGLSFKPKTDDIREAPSLILIEELSKNGAIIKAYDPVAIENVKKYIDYKNSIGYPINNFNLMNSPYETIQDTDCLIIVTEWDEFRYLDRERMKNLMRQYFVFDGRNIYDPEEMKSQGFKYYGIGRN